MKYAYKINRLTIILSLFAIIFSGKAFGESLGEIYDVLPNIDACERGELNDTQRNIILNEVNKLRAIHKLAPVTYRKEDEYQTQQGALMCTANNDINHTPPSSWYCYTSDGYSGTENSNLYIKWLTGNNWPSSRSAIVSWMIDSYTSSLGHRQAIINPFVKNISFGRVDGKPKVTTQWNASAMALQYRSGYNSQIDVDYIACPYENYPPEMFQNDWLLNFSAFYDKNNWYNNQNVDPSNVTIEVSVDGSGQQMNVTDIQFDNQGWGSVMNNLKWKVSGLQEEVRYNVSITNLMVNGVAKNYSYWFKLTDQGSSAEPPSAPTLSMPDNNADEVEAPVDFKWNASVGAETYYLQISKSSSFSSDMVYEDEEMTGTSYELATLEENTTYYWRVSATNENGTSDWSDTWNFTSVENIPEEPAAPTILEPADGATGLETKVKFAWEEVEDAEAYNIQISKFNDFEVTVQDRETVETALTFMKFDEGTTYYWRIASINSVGQGDWSETRSFTTKGDNAVNDYEDVGSEKLFAYPNPFSNSTTINYRVEKYENIKIEVYSYSGELVEVLINEAHDPGLYILNYTPKNLTSGVYFYTMSSPTVNLTKRFEVVK